MNIKLNPTAEKIVTSRVVSGEYASVEEVVAAALEQFGERAMAGDFASEEMDDYLAEGERSLHEAPAVDGEAAFEKRIATLHAGCSILPHNLTPPPTLLRLPPPD